MWTARNESGKARRHVLPILFSVAVHGALAGTIFGLSANKVPAPPERVYRVSLAELAAPEPPAPGPAAAAEPGPPEPPAPAPPPPPKPKPPKPTPPKPPPVVKKPDPKPPPVKRISTKKRERKEKEKPKPKPREVAVETPPTPPPRRPQRPVASEHASSSSSHTTATGLARPFAGRAGGRTGSGAGVGASGAGRGASGPGRGASGPGRGAAGSGVNSNAVYTQDKVDQRPAMTRAATPQYPRRARSMGVEGKVMVKLVVDKSGSPRNCAVASAKPPGYFEEAAVSAACRSRFSPGKIKGQPVNTLVVVPFAFRLN